MWLWRRRSFQLVGRLKRFRLKAVRKEKSLTANYANGVKGLKMEKGEWRKRYVQRLIDHYAFTKANADEVYQAGADDHDYEDNPEDAADEEISNWGN